MHFAFQDYDNLYLVMDLLTGGDLRYHISKVKKFSEDQTSNICLIRILCWMYNFWLGVYS